MPPISTTRADLATASGRSSFARKLAPRIELVGPELKVRMGCERAWGRLSRVPSLLVTNTGHARPKLSAAVLNAMTVIDAKGSKQAFRMVAFSRSSKPMLATVFEHVTKAPGIHRRTISATCSSCLYSKSIGANTEVIAMHRTC